MSILPSAVQLFQSSEGEWKQLGQTLNCTTVNSSNCPYYFGYSLSLSNDGKTIAIGSNDVYRQGEYGTWASIYTLTSDNLWEQKGNNITAGSNTNSGASVSLNADGTIVAVGSPGAEDCGRVGVYRYDGTQWNPIGGDIIGIPSQFCNIGWRVSINNAGDILSVDSRANEIFRVFHLSGTTWTQRGTDFSVPSQKNLKLSQSGNTVGYAKFDTRGRGEVHVLDWIPTTAQWEPRGTPFFIRPQAAQIGFAMSGDSNVVAQSAPDFGVGDYVGKAETYQWSASNAEWERLGQTLEGNIRDEMLGIQTSLSFDGQTWAVANSMSQTPDGIGINATLKVYKIG